MSPLIRDMGWISADRPTVVPPRTMHLLVIQAPEAITTGLVTKAMSTRWRWLPVVMNVSCEITTSCPTCTWSWL